MIYDFRFIRRGGLTIYRRNCFQDLGVLLLAVRLFRLEVEHGQDYPKVHVTAGGGIDRLDDPRCPVIGPFLAPGFNLF